MKSENEHAFCIRDRHPVSAGHSLIIPKKHVNTVFELPEDEYRACFDLVRTVREHLEKEHRPESVLGEGFWRVDLLSPTP